jgi:ATP synthase protein I
MGSRKKRQDESPLGFTPKSIQLMGRATTIGFFLVISTAIGFFIGNWLDHKLGTSPWLMLVFTLLGIIAGFRELIKLANDLSKEE